MFPSTIALDLSAADQRLLRRILRATTLSQALVRRARVILALCDGQTYTEIQATLQVSPTYIALWKRRVQDGGMLALSDAPRSGRPDRLDPKIEAKILARTQGPPPAPLTHWTMRRMRPRLG